MITLSAFAVLISVIATASLAYWALQRAWRPSTVSEPLRCAAFIVLTLAAIYGEVMLTGVLHACSWPVLGALNFVVVGALLYSDRNALRGTARLASRTVSLPFADCRDLGGRAFVAWLLLMIVVEGGVPKSVGDDVGYHLPSIMNIVHSGATLQIVPGQGADVRSPTAYYLRGYEATLALFFSAPGAHVYVVLVALAALTIVYLCLLEFTRLARLARALTFFLATGLMIGAPYKGDYLLAALALFVMTVLIRHGRALGAAGLPVLTALMLLLAIKSYTLMFVAVALLASVWQLRSMWPPARIALALSVTGTLGLAFYLGNLVYQGNPVYPFRVALAGRVLFDGPSTLDVLPGTILGNLGASMVVPFARGLARVTSPLAVLALPALLWLLWRYFRAPTRAESRPMALVFLVLCAVNFVTTPFSDNNGGSPHSQLYSGHTLRMALPLILLALALASSVVSAWSEPAATRMTNLLALMAAANVIGYDVAALLLKPANAFASYAPLFHSFDVRILAAGFAGLAGLALLAARAPRPLPILASALAAAALLRPLIEVSAFAYSPGFRNLGASSRIVAALTELADPAQSVSVLEDGATGPLRGIVTPVLLREFGRVEFARSPGDALGRDMVVVPSLVEETIGDLVHGRAYQVHKPTRALEALTRAGYVSLFEDPLYSVFAKSDMR